MPSIVLRLAAPVQVWAGYRYRFSETLTYPVPTKSGVAGLIGACLGERNPALLLDLFRLRIRVDHSNPPEVDLQVATGPKSGEVAAWKRTSLIDHPKAGWFKGSPDITGNKMPALANRQHLPFAEFITALEVKDHLVEPWLAALRRPVFMPYLGRRSNALTFPFLLGVHTGPDDVLAALPHVSRDTTHSKRPETEEVDAQKSTVRLLAYDVTGSYGEHVVSPASILTPPVTTRSSQLEWATKELTR